MTPETEAEISLLLAKGRWTSEEANTVDAISNAFLTDLGSAVSRCHPDHEITGCRIRGLTSKKIVFVVWYEDASLPPPYFLYVLDRAAGRYRKANPTEEAEHSIPNYK